MLPTTFQSLYMAFVMGIIYGHGLSSKEDCESLPKETKGCCIGHSFHKKKHTMVSYYKCIAIVKCNKVT